MATLEDWKHIDGFSMNENWGDPLKMNITLIHLLSAVRAAVRSRLNTKAKFIIHCGYEERESGGWHPTGKAVDLHVTGISLLDAFLFAERFNFGGIGLYPKWNNPGLHLDIGDVGRRWGCIHPKQYLRLDSHFIINHVITC